MFDFDRHDSNPTYSHDTFSIDDTTMQQVW